jgi:transposase
MGDRTSSNAGHRVAQDEAYDSQSPESSHYKTRAKGPEEAKKGALDPQADYELWFADGVRFELLPVVTYTYRRRGRPLRIPTPGKNARIAVCGGMRWPDGPFLFTHGPKSPNTALFVGLVQLLERRAKRTGKRIILVIDNGSAHTSKRSRVELDRVKSLIKPYWLPTYTSEQLNDIEGVWKHLKEDYFSRMLCRTREEFTDAAVRLLSTMHRGRMLRVMLKPRHRVAVSKNLTGVA